MKNKKYIFTVILMIIIVSTPVFPQNLNLDELSKKVDKFTDSMAAALPLNSAIGLNWSDAYIGQLLRVPPHFGVGVSLGATTMDYSSIMDMLSAFNINIPFVNNDIFKSIGMPLPGYAVEGRIGGFILPFDIGIKAGYLPQNLLGNISDDFNFGLKHMLVGLDFRYSLFSKKVLPIRISAGLGVNYLEGGINASIPTASSFEFTNPENSDSYTISASDTNAGLSWRTVSAELKTQISFPMKFFTPYAGAGVSYAYSTAGYLIKSEITVKKDNGDPVNLNDVNDILKGYGLTSISDSGFESMKNFHNISARAFAGGSINLWVIRIDLTAMYEFFSGNLGATFGLRFQL